MCDFGKCVVDFGKHRGMTIADVCEKYPAYAMWAHYNVKNPNCFFRIPPDMYEDTKRRAAASRRRYNRSYTSNYGAVDYKGHWDRDDFDNGDYEHGYEYS